MGARDVVDARPRGSGAATGSPCGSKLQRRGRTCDNAVCVALVRGALAGDCAMMLSGACAKGEPGAAWGVNPCAERLLPR
ncbi:hypothetical protein FOA52_013256 [Chlamydomonas sp. UWO 241]|nr:hypothetical protein FOA52_013256 [Chlamydomonas sp. UWO 241]